MSEEKDLYEMDVIYGPRRRERFAYFVAAAGVLVGLAGIGSAVSVLPLKEIQTHVVVVDKTTGDMDRIVQVQDMTLDERDAVVQALLVSYVDDRETYDLADSEERINAVLERSDGDAARTLLDLWTTASEDYPPEVYGPDAHIDVVIKSAAPIDENVYQIRFTRTLRRPRDQRSITRFYEATIGFEFRPEERRRLQDVWANPLGFVVTTYRVDAETLETPTQ